MPSEVFLQPYLSSDLGSVWLLPELGLLYLSSDLGGVWLFRIHGRGAAFKRLSRLGCAMFLVYALGLLSSFLFLVGSKGAVLDPPNVLFLLCLSSNLAGVLPFRNRALGGVSAAVPELGFR